MNLTEAESFILDKLCSELSETLYYHSVDHTLDVMEAAERIARAEDIADAESLALIRTAALYHDAGFLTTYQGHEAEGSRMVAEVLPGYDYSTAQIKLIQGMIAATKIPQKPQNKMEEILCDADLDYLGRADFEPIAELLYRELLARGRVTSRAAWDDIQIGFLAKHRYRTTTAQTTRQAAKQVHLQEIRRRVDSAERPGQ